MNISILLFFVMSGFFKTGMEPQPGDCWDLREGNEAYEFLRGKADAGEPLMVYGKVIDKNTGTPIENAELFFYQAGEDGEYHSVFLGMPSFAKIRGSLETGKDGCFKIETIVPGNYPDQVDGKHIHV